MSVLPKGWVEATVDEVIGPNKDSLADGPYGSKLKSSHYTAHGVRVIRLGNIGKGEYLSSTEAFISEDYFRELQKHEVIEGDIVMAALGDPIGRCCLVPSGMLPAMVKADCFRIRLGKAIDARFFVSWMNSEAAASLLSEQAHGIGRLRINLSDLRQMSVPLPPLAEQKRIVAKLDELNAKSARARTELARIEALVSRYKQAVLSKAFGGELTAAQVSKSDVFNASSRAALRHPQHWRLKPLGDIAEIKSGITLGKKRKPDEQLLELPYLRVANVQRGWLDLDEIKTVQVTAKEAEALFLRDGDILMNEGGDRDKLGRGWVWGGQIADCIHQNHVFRVRLAPGTVPPRFLSYYANEFGQAHFFDQGKQTTNLASISKSKLSAMEIPIPPFEEAAEIVRRIESAFARIDRLAAQAKRALELVGKLDEAILAKAFRGELVPQDDNDEPAEKLLERIRAERIVAPKARRLKQSGYAAPKLAADMNRSSEMAMTRDDVEKDHLVQLLRSSRGSSQAKDLWLRSGMDIDEFYKQLRSEMDSGQICEGAEKDLLVLADAH